MCLGFFILNNQWSKQPIRGCFWIVQKNNETTTYKMEKRTDL